MEISSEYVTQLPGLCVLLLVKLVRICKGCVEEKDKLIQVGQCEAVYVPSKNKDSV
jgi:hypothetical protein